MTINEWKTSIEKALPDKSDVLKRNSAITACYARLYKMAPQLYKWAGMAAFASHHVGEQMHKMDWKKNGVRTLSEICKSTHSLQDDFQLIRIINNKIFADIGWIHLAFCELKYSDFQNLLSENLKYQKLAIVFFKLNQQRECLKQKELSDNINKKIWEANCNILWHEQSEVVQPMFNEISGLFSAGMTLFASFHYQIDHFKPNWKTHSNFILFMLFGGMGKLMKTGLIPNVTNLDQRWYWIYQRLLPIWERTNDDDCNRIMKKINWLN